MINDPRLFLALSPRLLSLYLATTIHPNFYIPNGYILVLRRSEELKSDLVRIQLCVEKIRTKISSEKFIHYGELS